MSIEETKEKMKSIQNALLEFLEDESIAEENYENFLKSVSEYQITEDKYKLKSVLQLINAVGNNHRRVKNFFCKLEQILVHFKKDIEKYFKNSEVFEVFENNKRILLFLIEEKIMIIDEYIASRIARKKYLAEYFAPELKPFFTEEFIKKYGDKNLYLREEIFINNIKKEVSEDFYDKRKEGENDNYLCELIRTNQVKEFGIYVNRNNIPYESCIDQSIFETNPLLNNSEVKLIEYASFYGSIDIIRYMRINGNATLTSMMWIYAIHSENAELIRYLEDNNVSPLFNDYKSILVESIKCHHRDVSKYIIDYLMKEENLQNDIENEYFTNIYRSAVQFHNYCFFPSDMKYKYMFYYLCEFDYYTLVKLYLEEGNIDINATIKTFNYLNDIQINLFIHWIQIMNDFMRFKSNI